MTRFRIAFVAALSLFAGACATGGDNFSRDGANDRTSVDSSGTTESATGDVGEESRNVDFRSSTSALPDSAHPSTDRNTNGKMVNEGQSRDGSPN